MSNPQQPRRRRIAGEAKPGEAAAAPPPPVDVPIKPTKPNKPNKPKLPKRPKAAPAEPPAPVEAAATVETAEPVEPVESTDVGLPAAPPRPESVRVPRKKPSVTVVALLVLAIASLGFGAFGVWRGIDEWRSASIVESRSGAVDAASSAAEKIFSYRYNRLDEHLRDSQKTMTPKFAKKFRSISPALKALAPQRKIQVKAVVRFAAAKECGDACSPEKSTVLIFLDQARVSADTEKPTVFGNRIEVSMVERDGKWLVDNIKAL